MTHRVTSVAAAGLVAAGIWATGASASVLVPAPVPLTKDCGSSIEVGVWWRDDGRAGSRKVTISVRSVSGRTLWRKRVRATSQWRYWHYTPECGRRYVVRYRKPAWGNDDYRIRMRR